MSLTCQEVTISLSSLRRSINIAIIIITIAADGQPRQHCCSSMEEGNPLWFPLTEPVTLVSSSSQLINAEGVRATIKQLFRESKNLQSSAEINQVVIYTHDMIG